MAAQKEFGAVQKGIHKAEIHEYVQTVDYRFARFRKEGEREKKTI